MLTQIVSLLPADHFGIFAKVVIPAVLGLAFYLTARD
jgi:hypothetical protein